MKLAPLVSPAKGAPLGQTHWASAPRLEMFARQLADELFSGQDFLAVHWHSEDEVPGSSKCQSSKSHPAR
eukprot:8538012-Pyramimonas_sp.AAC.1